MSPLRRTSPRRATFISDKNQSPLLIYSSVLATLAALLSLWVAYKQYGLQDVQTRFSAEQTEISRLQAKTQVAQNLPLFHIERHFESKSGRMTLLACSSQDGLLTSSGFKVRWIARLGRYTMPATSSDAIKTIDVKIDRQDEVVWHTAELTKANSCAWTEDVSWIPLSRLLNKVNVPHARVGYFIWLETLVTVYLRDATGEIHPRHYLLSKGNPALGELLSESEATKWVNEHLTAERLGRFALIANDESDISTVVSFFKEQMGSDSIIAAGSGPAKPHFLTLTLRSPATIRRMASRSLNRSNTRKNNRDRPRRGAWSTSRGLK
jgi:hypothetical protein